MPLYFWFWQHSMFKRLLIQEYLLIYFVFSFMGISQTLPMTGYIKMIDIWMIFTISYPFVVITLHCLDKLTSERGTRRINVESSGEESVLQTINHHFIPFLQRHFICFIYMNFSHLHILDENVSSGMAFIEKCWQQR